ncbi:maleylacetate reductase [Amycolatopsis deserti]|uniref:Maleylacetate reductase n=1 Tax=Amycolatopsis deserti TaxID=185696 RepID=A0ABQ3IGK6_9PSEU|nr:maleylacetate reductase [Amycolatopsis deserti]GHE80630.1 maleylacetate reductase [Amycolatopsis deserti]
MTAFVHQQRAARVVFGSGAIERLAEEADRTGAHRVVLITSSRYHDRARSLLGNRVVATITDPPMHVPRADAESVREQARAAGADAAVAVGGGSAIGLAKALALQTHVPVLAVPTTYAGSEMTRVWGITENGVKRTGRDPVVAPRSVVYDPDLVATLPPKLAVPSAFNAVAHAVEALYAPDRTPVTDLLAAEAVRLIAEALPGLSTGSGADTALRGAWLAGVCLDSTTMGLHHKLCHVLGGTLGLPHAETHTVVLPHALAYNAAAIPDAVRILRTALPGGRAPAATMSALAYSTGAPTALSQLGMTASDVDIVVRHVLAAPYANPVPVTEYGVRALLERALRGEPPA